MPTFRDRYGLILTTSSAAAAEHYTTGMDLLLGHRPGAADRFARASEEDGGFALPYAVRAYTLWATGDVGAAAAEIGAAQARLGGVSARERGHVELVAARIGNEPGVLDRMRSHVAAFPTDALILRLAYFATVFGGREHPERDAHALLASVAPAYGDDWWFMGLFALSHEELGQVGRARELAEAAMAGDGGGCSGAHPLAHVLYAGGAHREGRAFLGPWLRGYERAAPFRAHMAWHLALFALAEHDRAGAYQVWRDDILAAPAQSYALLDDMASLLWRLALAGHPVADRDWQEACARAEPSLHRPGFAFRDVHAALAFAGAGDDESLDRLHRAQLELAEHGHPVAGTVVAPVVEGVAAFAGGDFRTASERLAAARPSLTRLGGTRSQREVFDDTLLAAYLEIGATDRATHLAAARLSARPDR